jgi:hypothetical protein
VKKQKILRVVFVVLICVVMILPQVPVFACGPFFPEAYFIFTKHPDLPLDNFAAGELGILQPTYARSYLVVAYRYLNGANLSKVEQAEVISLWKDRLEGESLYGDVAYADVTPAEAKWFRTRTRVPGVPSMRSGKDFLTDKNRGYWNYIEVSSRYDSHVNCLDPAFETAANTLQTRIQKFGVASPAVRSWVSAQDAVFALCDGAAPKSPAAFPVQADGSLPEIISADRAYQAAEAHFYAGEYDAARELFSQISRDAHSQWRATGALMVARSMIRKATLFAPNPESEKATLSEARSVLQSIVKDRSMTEMHHPAKDLISFIDARISPAEYAHSLAQILVRPNNTNLRHDLDDYTILLNKWLVQFDDPDWDENRNGPKQFTKPPVTLLPSAIRTDQLTDWILTFQSPDAGASAHAIQRWRQTGSVAWLVAALSKLRASTPESDDLLTAARRVEPDSPGYFTVLFDVLRIEALSGGKDAARSELDAFLEGHADKLPRSALNLFLGLRMSVARNLEELLRFAPRVPALIGSDEDELELSNSVPFVHKTTGNGGRSVSLKPQFDVDAAWTFTRALPTAMLVDAVERKTLPTNLRSEVANSAWVRAIVLDDEPNALRLAPTVGELEPKLAAEMNAYIASTDHASRRFNGILSILRTPGLRPFVTYGAGRDTAIEKVDSYANNWWCSLDDAGAKSGSHAESMRLSDLWRDLTSPLDIPDKPVVLGGLYPEGRFAAPSFLSPEERGALEGEWKQLENRGSGTLWLAQYAFDWARSHPDDPRAPESLHHVVHVLRYSCGEGGGESNLSHLAFNLLHRKYPNSEWTKKTPYWF